MQHQQMASHGAKHEMSCKFITVSSTTDEHRKFEIRTIVSGYLYSFDLVEISENGKNWTKVTEPYHSLLSIRLGDIIIELPDNCDEVDVFGEFSNDLRRFGAEYVLTGSCFMDTYPPRYVKERKEIRINRESDLGKEIREIVNGEGDLISFEFTDKTNDV